MDDLRLKTLKQHIAVARGPDRALDVTVAVALDWRDAEHEEGDRTAKEMAEKHGIDWLISRSQDGIASIWRHLPRFTASMDAALSLLPDSAERRIEFGRYGEGRGSWAYVCLDSGEPTESEVEGTEVLAVLACAIEASDKDLR